MLHWSTLPHKISGALKARARLAAPSHGFWNRITGRVQAGGRARFDQAFTIASAGALILVATVIGELSKEAIGDRNLALLFLIAVGLSGFWFGLTPALAAAVAAFVSYNFFLVDPRFELSFTPPDILALASFLSAALVIGGLSGRLSDRARIASERLMALNGLFEASRELGRATSAPQAREILLAHLHRHGARAAIWIEADGALDVATTDDAMTAAAHQHAQTAKTVWRHRAQEPKAPLRWLKSPRGPVALAYVMAGDGRAHATQADFVETLIDLGVVALERAALVEEVAEARVVAAREGLRSALLSSVSHDLRTPIAAILASATSLQSNSIRFDEATRQDLISTIQEETERLDRYVGHLLNMTRLESGVLDVKATPVDPREALVGAVERMRRRLQPRRIEYDFPPHTLVVHVDPVLLEQVLANILENAVAYSPINSVIRLGVQEGPWGVAMTVEDEGEGIPPGDIDRIFQKFFRGRNDRRRPSGVGLGLAVAKGIVEAFGGEIRAISPVRDNRGARFEIRLPAHELDKEL